MDTLPPTILSFILWLADSDDIYPRVCKTFSIIHKVCKKSNTSAWAKVVASHASLLYHRGIQKYEKHSDVTREAYYIDVLCDRREFKILVDIRGKFALNYLDNTFPFDPSNYPPLFKGRILFRRGYDHTRLMLSYVNDKCILFISGDSITENVSIKRNKKYVTSSTDICVGSYYLQQN